MRKEKTAWMTPLLLAAVTLVMWAVLHALTGIRFAGSTAYNTYTRQAMAWREGHAWVQNAEYLELAIFNGQYYVSFPPLPSVILYPLTFLFGMDTPDNLLVKAYALGACMMMYFAFVRAGYRRGQAALTAFLFTFASSLLPLTLEGAVWYHAQVLAFFLTVAAICLLTLDKPTGALFLYALSVGCRPFNALYGLPLFFVYCTLCREKGVRYMAGRLWKGVLAGLAVAAALAGYNAVRFGNPLEFGHNYLPEFSFQGGVQFSLGHLADNLRTALAQLPFTLRDGRWEPEKFGFAVAFACPVLLLMAVWFIEDCIRDTVTWSRGVVVITALIHFFLLMTHRTFGGYQFGARYCADLIPYAFFYQLLRSEKKRLPWWQIAGLALGLALMLWGSVNVHL